MQIKYSNIVNHADEPITINNYRPNRQSIIIYSYKYINVFQSGTNTYFS